MKDAPHISVKTYVAVFLALLALTALTTAVAFVDLGGGWNNVVALTIAVVKALLVILYFMHVRTSDRFTWVLAGAGFFWLLILLGGTLDDLLTRSW
jgi:cytochrome c oxidase subunit 4